MPNRASVSGAFSGWLAAGLLLLVPGHLRAGADEPEYTLEAITARLKEWEGTIQTLRVHTKTVHDSSSKRAIEAHLEGVQWITYSDWLWTRAAFCRHHQWETRNGRPFWRSLEADDGAQSWHASYANGDNESTPREVRRGTINPNYPNRHAPPYHLRHLYFSAPGTTAMLIGEAIEKGLLEFAGSEVIDDRRCVLMRYTFSNASEGAKRRAGGPVQENYLLDPEHGFLPIQVELPRSRKYTVQEFFEPEPGFWFPKRGKYVDRMDDVVEMTEDWEITAVELNQDQPSSLWEPPVVKTKEPDLAEKAAAKGKEFRHSAWLFGISMTGLDFWLAGGFLVVAVIFLVGVLLVYYRRRKRKLP